MFIVAVCLFLNTVRYTDICFGGIALHKNKFVLLVSLFIFWLILSSSYDFQHIIVGLILAIGLTWIWQDAADELPNSTLSIKTWLKFLYYLLLLGWEILLANIAVIKSLIFDYPDIEPEFVYFKSNLKTKWGRVILANSITITPGTVTVDVNPDNGDFLVHALTKEMAEQVRNSKLIQYVRNLETCRSGINEPT